jgi:DHA2 family multidrug resistance protein-like MFS transporter
VSSNAVAVAKGSLGGALSIAHQAGAAGDQLANVARSAFVDGMHGASLVAAAAAAIGAVVVALFLPAHARREDVVEQAHEYEDELELAELEGERIEVVTVG